MEDFQKIVNDTYATLVKQWTSQGFEIMDADEDLKFEYFAEWTKLKGGANSDVQAVGYVMVTP